MAAISVDKGSTKRGSPGRPKGSGTIPDSHLHGWRDDFLWPFEHNWGHIGYGLLQATETAHIRDVFLSLPESARSRFLLFTRPYSKIAKTLQQRRKGKLYGAVTKLARFACDVEDKARNSVNVAVQALRAAQGTSQQQAMEHEHEVRSRLFKQTEQRRIELDQLQRALSEELADEAVGFAQSELLDFLLDRRYELTPINLANAMAGLPHMAWRQSFKRCMRWEHPNFANSVVYREFKVISAGLRADVKAGSQAERMRLYLQRKKVDKETRDPVKELKQKWFYLKNAIEQVQAENHPPQLLPFRVMDEYQRRFSGHTSVDEILAQEARLW